MRKNSENTFNKIMEKTVRTDKRDLDPPTPEESEYSRTQEIARDAIMGEIPTKKHGLLYFTDSGEIKRQVQLEEGEAIIGRSPSCDIQIEVENVSRRHARIIFRNEEYQIEDMGSTNGVYVNGIKVEKCVLRDHDQINVGGVKIFFSEEKIQQKK
jgi:pSer/pThr/pTyr-binding forkhead associated (FHA) protein